MGSFANEPRPALTHRLADAHDAGEIARLYVEGWQHLLAEHQVPMLPAGTRVDDHERRWRSDLLNRSSRSGAMLALADHHAVGLCAWRPASDGDGEAELIGFHLEKAYRGHHEGRRLLDATYTAIRAMGYSTVVVWMWFSALEVRRYLERHGFRASGERRGIEIGQPLHEVRLSRPLIEDLPF